MTTSSSHSAAIKARLSSLHLGKRTLVMGIVNVTPDSFSGDGLDTNQQAAIDQAHRMAREGADLVDIGGQSTRPGAQSITAQEEIGRVLPVIQQLRSSQPLAIPISIDTNRSVVAEAALRAGADIVNDISGLRDDPAIANVVAEFGAGLILMHIQGTPDTMQQNPHYHDLLSEVIAYLQNGIVLATAARVPLDHLWVDPGIGFGKTVEHNLELLRRLSELKVLGCPIMVGTSRKGFIGKILSSVHGGTPPPPAARAIGSGATVALAIANGASIVRVHDVAHSVDVARVADAVVRGYLE